MASRIWFSCASHRGDNQRLIMEELENVQIIQFAESVEVLDKIIISLIRSSQVLGVCSKTLQNVVITVGAYRSMEDIGHARVGVLVPVLSSHEFKYFTPVGLVKSHQVIVLVDIQEVLLVSSQPLELSSCFCIVNSQKVIFRVWFVRIFPGKKRSLQSVLCLANLKIWFPLIVH